MVQLLSQTCIQGTSSLKPKAKNKAWATFDNFPNIDNLDIALTKQGSFDNLEIKAKLNYEKGITNDLKHDSKAFIPIYVTIGKFYQL